MMPQIIHVCTVKYAGFGDKILMCLTFVSTRTKPLWLLGDSKIRCAVSPVKLGVRQIERQIISNKRKASFR